MSSFLRKLAAAAILSVGVAILAWVIHDTDNAGNKDFTSYWAAGQLLVHGSNPYNAADVLRLEKSVGFRPDHPLIMRNPPYALLLALPLGLVGAKTGTVLWSLLLVGAIGLSVRILWADNGRPHDLHLFGYMFAPALACLRMGQTAAFILLGLVLFLRWYKQRPLAAGACLVLLAIKPHLFLPLGLILLLWILLSRRYQIALGAVLAMAAALAVPMLLDHTLWSDYRPVLADASAESQLMPTVSSLFRLIVSPHATWLQFLPALAGCIWALFYFYRHRADWEWNEHGLTLLVVSVMVAPYAWLADEIVVLPAMLLAIFRCAAAGRSFAGFLVLNGIALAAMLFAGVPQDSGFYVWTPVAWTAWYVWARSRTRSAALCASPVA
ncbi:MAG TPA: glycosyltransferase 87 family protein [Candidatus Angelobacter sp.]|nr:glycosyltransferase 87 family protein [Candidatus Angelobacter sp.]